MLRTATIAAGAIAAVAGLGAAPASAQLFWDWGGGGTVGGSGRESVRFSPQFKKGEIIVSFGDRRLYFITGAGPGHQLPDRRSARGEPLGRHDQRHQQAHQPILDADPGDDARKTRACRVGCRAAIP